VKRVPVAAKINLALVVGSRREDGLHEVATVLQRVDLCDTIELGEGASLQIEGFGADTLVRRALERLGEEAEVEPRWRVRIGKRIPLAAGLGGASADAAGALQLANATLPRPLGPGRLAELAATLGADVPFFLTPGPKLAEGAGERLIPLELPQDYWVVIAIGRAASKRATGDVYRRFDELDGAPGFDERRATLLAALERCRRPRDFASFPANDLAQAAGRSALPDQLRSLGAFRADVTGAGPAAYGLFHHRDRARRAARALGPGARAWVSAPVW
jgi:4-diphosphocytidyl-2-C-methyl-D-erythritol kinase